MNQNISVFFAERKAAWLKNKLKSSLTDEEQAKLQQEANEKFSLPNWLPDAAKRVSQLTMVSHPSKFSHPSAKTSSVISDNNPAHDGYLRSGNVDYKLDVFGNAAAMDVYKFLSLLMNDNETILMHLEKDSPEIKSLLTLPTESYDSLKLRFLSIKQLDDTNKTDHLVKQIYFPVDEDYHLLSVLTPSGLLAQVRNRIDTIRFSDETKQAKEYRKKNEPHTTGYDDIFNLTITAYGGSNPQNVSVLNAQMNGKAYLLSSTPPLLKQRAIRLPSNNFFKNSLRPKQFTEAFQSLDKLIRTGINNIHVREGIRNSLKYIIDQVLQRVFSVRAYGTGWSQTKQYLSLPLAQRIWLDNVNLKHRENQEDWLEDVVAEFSRWILNTYEYLFKETYTQLSDKELREIRHYVDEAVSSDQEFFK